jgi:hypothetical protein
MPAPSTIDRTLWELSAEVGPWKRSRLYRVGLAVKAAGAADSQDSALALICDAADALGGRPTVREAIEQAGVDVRAVVSCLRQIDADHQQARDALEVAQLREASHGAAGQEIPLAVTRV